MYNALASAAKTGGNAGSPISVRSNYSVQNELRSFLVIGHSNYLLMEIITFRDIHPYELIHRKKHFKFYQLRLPEQYGILLLKKEIVV